MITKQNIATIALFVLFALCTAQAAIAAEPEQPVTIPNVIQVSVTGMGYSITNKTATKASAQRPQDSVCKIVCPLPGAADFGADKS